MMLCYRHLVLPHSRLVAKLTKRLKSPNALDVSVLSLSPPSPLPDLSKLGKPPPLVAVGEKRFADEGEVTICPLGGSISRCVRKEVSDRSSFVEVTERKMSRSFCWSFRGVPLRSRIWRDQRGSSTQQ
jgi:hypothetical protein